MTTKTTTNETALLHAALVELALAAYPDLRAVLPDSPLHGSSHVQAKLRSRSPNLVALVERQVAAEREEES